jgi:hypothetical protein
VDPDQLVIREDRYIEIRGKGRRHQGHPVSGQEKPVGPEGAKKADDRGGCAFRGKERKLPFRGFTGRKKDVVEISFDAFLYVRKYPGRCRVIIAERGIGELIDEVAGIEFQDLFRKAQGVIEKFRSRVFYRSQVFSELPVKVPFLVPETEEISPART